MDVKQLMGDFDLVSKKWKKIEQFKNEIQKKKNSDYYSLIQVPYPDLKMPEKPDRELQDMKIPKKPDCPPCYGEYPGKHVEIPGQYDDSIIPHSVAVFAEIGAIIAVIVGAVMVYMKDITVGIVAGIIAVGLFSFVRFFTDSLFIVRFVKQVKYNRYKKLYDAWYDKACEEAKPINQKKKQQYDKEMAEYNARQKAVQDRYDEEYRVYRSKINANKEVLKRESDPLLKKDNDKIRDQIKILKDEINQILDKYQIGKDYRDADTIKRLGKIISNGRADSVKEALNICEKERAEERRLEEIRRHNMTMEEEERRKAEETERANEEREYLLEEQKRQMEQFQQEMIETQKAAANASIDIEIQRLEKKIQDSYNREYTVSLTPLARKQEEMLRDQIRNQIRDLKSKKLY